MQLLELVPREWETLETEARESMAQFSQISGFNIPDVRRLSIRSLEVVPKFQSNGWHIVPHIRSRDMSLDRHLSQLKPYIEAGLSQLLVIRGDEIKQGVGSFGCSSLELISGLRKAFPELTIYGAIDPYRSAWEQECRYAQQKIEHGADGFFTQPIFDPLLAETVLDAFSDHAVYLGVAPVASEKSKAYWETVNNVTFPDRFVFDLPGSAAIVREVLAVAESKNQHLYHMPIVIDPITYLTAVFGS